MFWQHYRKKERYIKPKSSVKESEGSITTNFHKKKVPYVPCKYMTTIKLGNVYKQRLNHYA